MGNTEREAWITGIGMVSCLGEGPDAHWQALSDGKKRVDAAALAPFMVHPLAAVDFDKQIPKKGDQRQMEAWQRIGTYAAGLALDNAGVKGNAELLARMDMIVAAGGGERDINVDGVVMTGISKAADPAAFLNERLMNDLRPTLFLAQLSNLLAGNISIVHGVTGSSRTFMGEEAAGVDATRIALSRILAGQSEITLVGGANNGERKDLLMFFVLGGFALKGDYRPIWERSGDGGFVLGSIGAFLVIEERRHAQARGALPIARLVEVQSGRSARTSGTVTTALRQMWEKFSSRLHSGSHAAISGATGVQSATAEERAFFAEHPEIPVRATGTYLGHGLEPQFPMNIALAALALNRGTLFPPGDSSGVEQAKSGTLTQVLVTSVGHWRGEGMALLDKVG